MKSVLWAYSNPKWPVEWVANWSIIPPSASMRGQNRPPNISLGGRGTPLKSFSGYRATLHCNSGLPCHERRLAIKTPNPKWPVARVAIWPKKCPNRHQRGGKTGPQHPPLGGGGPHSIYFRATGRLYTTMHCKSELPCH